jgi:PAS domain S-box-containing protein
MEDIVSLKNKIAELTAENNELKSKEHQAAILSEDQRYQESQVRFKTVFEMSRLGNKIISSDLKILQLNPAMVTLLGYESKEEIVGSVILNYVPEDYHKDWRFLQEKLWEKASPSFSLETCLQQKDGTKIWCQVTSILFPDSGQTLGYTIIENVTEQHNLRQQKEEFISIASHELKTPITSLQAVVQIINRIISKDPMITEPLRKLANDAERHTKKLNHLVGDLLNTTKIEKGQLTLNKNSFTISEMVDGCCSHLQFNGNPIVYTGDHSIKVTADQHKIDQVLVNLVNNALKYAPESLDIIVHVEKMDKFTRVSVIDQGPGIPSENLEKLFDRYYRVQEQRQISGLGLGLYIASEIIERHGGQMGVESEPGIGSTFWFTLPDIEQ